MLLFLLFKNTLPNNNSDLVYRLLQRAFSFILTDSASNVIIKPSSNSYILYILTFYFRFMHFILISDFIL